ncbi:uncharacterized protein A1O9_07682 [Exophiala aquamarina CBS 119918]|uniref:Zn(2)-C6 fungal-type domain-containing protein n=1 Tax=Exophiala aquamarina CBS 119918 TaxID=1182545 RepID=A0A072P887_9EURO|nr:uncharacterized protein A1O9_07682 [Exophiala aquamarina CBS 119918]KEF56101.1 hypothetical protein A1O9_07682 [Exophiala aquamarina CBS 119918]
MSATPQREPPDSDAHTGRQVQKRASQACHQCRSRKIKCDLVDTGAPCNNCQVDHIECTTSLSKRTRKYRLLKAQLLRNSASCSLLLPRKQTETTITSSSPKSEATAISNEIFPPQPKNDQVPHPCQPVIHESACLDHLPPYIRRPPHKIKPGELEYLSHCGALSVPDDELRDQLLLSVLLYVYPFLPVLDLQEFLDGVEGKDGAKLSLILFQAVMFAGTAFVDLHYLLDAGFDNRIAARSHFFQKIKLLYDFGWETDRVILIQSTLLHAYWYVCTNDQKDPWYWLGVCLSLATGIGLNVESTYESLNARTCRLWRRIWWTCVSRDRIMCLLTRRQMRIKYEETSLPTLKFKDFDTQPLSTKIELLRDSPVVNDCVYKVMLADMFMSKVDLLLIAGQIVAYAYNVQRFDSSTTEWAMFYAPKPKRDLDSDSLDQLQSKLGQWSRNLNSYCHIDYHDDHETSDVPPKLPGSVLLVHRATLKLVHLMAEEALLRPLTFPEGPQQRSTPVCSKPEDSSTAGARLGVSRIATEIGQIVHGLRQKNVLGYAHPLVVGCLLTAVASILVDIRLERKSLADAPAHQYNDCVQSLMTLSEVWPIAERTLAMVNQMATNNQIWFARSLKMLCKPLSTTSKQTPASEGSAICSPYSPKQDGQDRIQSDHTYGADGASVIQVPSSLNLPCFHENGGPGQTSVGIHNSHTSNYLAFMYPFPWTAADFDVFDPNTCQELFADHSVDTFDAGGTFNIVMPAYPSALEHQHRVEDTTERPSTTLPDIWR